MPECGGYRPTVLLLHMFVDAWGLVAISNALESKYNSAESRNFFLDQEIDWTFVMIFVIVVSMECEV
jgi:cell division protein FtsW (lipid II flippase)